MHTLNSSKNSSFTKIPNELQAFFTNFSISIDQNLNIKIYNRLILPYHQELIQQLLRLKHLKKDYADLSALKKIQFLKRVYSASVLNNHKEQFIYQYYHYALEDTDKIKWQLDNLIFYRQLTQPQKAIQAYAVNVEQKISNILRMQYLLTLKKLITTKIKNNTAEKKHLLRWVNKEIEAFVISKDASVYLERTDDLEKDIKRPPRLYQLIGAKRLPIALQWEWLFLQELKQNVYDLFDGARNVVNIRGLIHLFDLMLCLLQNSISFLGLFYRLLLTAPQELDYLFIILNDQVKIQYPHLWASNNWFLFCFIANQLLKTIITGLIALTVLPLIYTAPTVLLMVGSLIALEILKTGLHIVKQDTNKLSRGEKINHASKNSSHHETKKPILNQYTLKFKHKQITDEPLQDQNKLALRFSLKRS